MNTITKEDVQAKRYKNSDKVPEVGDVVTNDANESQTVAQLGGCMSMFHNCIFNNRFVLTHPELCTLTEK
jgi:hypothetical protein